jgi:mevalonate pyrophosphate decarboxylase
VVSENNFPTAAGLASSASGLSVCPSILSLSSPLPAPPSWALACWLARVCSRSLSLSFAVFLNFTQAPARSLPRVFCRALPTSRKGLTNS